MSEYWLLALVVRARAGGDLSRRLHRRRKAVRAAARRARARAGGPLGAGGSVPGVAEPLLPLSQRQRRSARAPGSASRSRCSRSARFRSRWVAWHRPRSGRRCGCCICRSSTSARRFTASDGKRCCSRSASSPSSPARAATAPNMWLIWIWRWTLFRLMFGAGLIKLRGDPCWRDLTCLNYYFETQPMPNPLSWYFHWLPHGIHAAGVVVQSHRRTDRAVRVFRAAAVRRRSPASSRSLFQGVLIVSGNLSWLNWLTLVLCIPLISDRWLGWLPVRSAGGSLDRCRRIRSRLSCVARGRGVAQHRARHEHAVAAPDDERQLRAAASGEHVRRVRQHHARAL